MITSIHTLIYSDDPDATRAFLRDVLGWPYVEADPGWLIFGTGPSELGVHPTSNVQVRNHEITLMCDDIDKTVVELTAKGVEFTGEVQDMGWGRTVNLLLPGAGEIMLYQPQHPTAYEL